MTSPHATCPGDAPPTVLIVDADPDARRDLGRSLGDAFAIVEASGPDAALELAQDADVDVIVADVGSGGRALVATMTAHERLGAVPVLMVADDPGDDPEAYGVFAKGRPASDLVGPLRSAVRLHRWVRRHRAVIDGVPIGIVSVGLDGRILEANHTLGEILETDPNDLVGRTTAEIDPSTDWPSVLQHAIHAGIASFEWPRTVGGTTRRLRIDVRPVYGRDGRVSRLDGIVEDITDRTRREHLIARSNEQLAALYEVGTDVSSTLELDPVLQTIARETRRLVEADWSRITLAAHGSVEEALVAGTPPPSGSHFTGITGWVHDNAKTASTPDAALDPRGVDEAHGPLIVAPLLADDTVIGTLEAGRTTAEPFTDLEIAGTDMLAGQASVAIRNARLWDELRRSHESLQTAHLELGRTQAKLLQVQRLESIGELAAGIAHEINTPIQYVGDNTRFLAETATALDRLARAAAGLRGAAERAGLSAAVAAYDNAVAPIDLAFLTAEAASAAEQALEGVDRVARIVRAMKEFAHPGPDEFAPVDLNRTVTTTLAVARNEWKYVADVDTDLDPDLGAVPGLAGPLNQAVLNILVNAAHAIGETSRSTGERGRISVTTRREGAWATLRIGDTGPGIPESIVDRIYDPFFTTKGVGRGSGQGLAIARNAIVDQHHGQLDVETEVGAGTTFVIRLPVDRKEDET